MSDVFVSYKAEDRARVRPLVEALEADGLSIWWDAHLGGGDEWRDSIQEHLAGARCVIVAWSKRSVGPDGSFVRDEATRALRRHVYLAVRIDKVDPPLGFGETQAFPLTGWKGDRADPRYQAVLGAARAIIEGKPHVARASATADDGISRRTLIAAFGVLVAAGGAALLWLGARDGDKSSAVPVAELASTYSLAVLPLANLSGDPEQEYFADGMTDLMITHLARSPRLRVTSRTSTLRYEGGQKPIPEIARELNVDLVVEGTIVREGERVRITVQLIRAQTDEHIWANSFERDFSGVLALQQEVAQAVADEIGVELAPWQSATAANPQAQEQYLRGIYSYGMGDMMGSAEALERAVVLDPDHALAYAALARSYYFIAFFGDRSPSEAFEAMEAAATKALEKDPTLASAHGSLALVKLHRDWNWSDAEQHFRRAIELNPSNADVHHDYAHFLLVVRRDGESLAETERALALDPFNPMLNACLGWHSLFSGRYDQAIDVARRTLQIHPTNFWARVNLGWAYEQKAMYAEAVSEFKQASEQKPMSMGMGPPMEPMGPPMQMSAEAARIKATRADLVVLAAASLGHALGRAGDHPGARALLDRLLRQREHAYVSPYDIALLYTGLGENDNALDWLQRAYKERSALLVFALREPRLAPLRREPRFATLAREFALPP